MMNKNITIGGFLLMGVICVTSLTLSVCHKPLKLGVVDTRLIITEQAKRIAKEDPKAHTSIMKMRAVADKIEGQIAHWGKIHKVTLFSKQAVLSDDLPDYTQLILTSLVPEGHVEGAHP
jgi:hypothetical protein